MDPVKKVSDQETMAKLREPIDHLIEKYCSDKDEFQKLRLRQLAWQAVDVLVRTGNISRIDSDPNIKRITRDIKQLGASDTFIEESLHLAVTIFRKMQAEYPGLLKKYG